MQAIITIILVLLTFAEAGLIAKAPRTQNAALQTQPPQSQFYIITSSSSSPTTPSPTRTSIKIPPPTDTSRTMTTPGIAISPNIATQNPGSYKPVITTTPAPGDKLKGEGEGEEGEEGEGKGVMIADGEQMKFVQTTYFACVTNALATHCGWHEPILDASSGAATTTGRGGGDGLALRASLLATFAIAVLFIGL